MFRGSVKGTGYPHHSPVSPSLPLPCITVCHQVSTGLYIPVNPKDRIQFTGKLHCAHTSIQLFSKFVKRNMCYLWKSQLQMTFLQRPL